MVDAVTYRTILLFGMPGSGKGTQGAVLGQLPGVVHISSGDLFRRLPKHGELGREVVNYTSQGLLVPDDLTIRIWRRHLQILTLQEEAVPGNTTLVLDGLPRNRSQAEQLAEFLDVVQVFHLSINDVEEAKDRLAARSLRENRLDDINEEVVRKRLQLYRDETVQTLGAYDPAIIFEIDASQSPLKVHADITVRLAELEAEVRRAPASPEAMPDADRSALTGAGDADRTPSPVG